MRKFLLGFLVLLILLVIIYFLGPKPERPKIDRSIPTIEMTLENVEEKIRTRESAIEDLRPNNDAEVVWYNDSLKQKTEYSLVYLHGFSASPMEGDPIHREFAKRYGCNMYLARLAGHGFATKESFKETTVEEIVDSAKEAIAIGKLLGEKVILMSTSTGGTLSFYLAAGNDDIVGLINYSPNIDMAAAGASLLNKPWGLEIARWMMGSDYRGFEATEEIQKYWTNLYRIEGVVTLKSMLDATMTDETFEQINQPTFIAYYYKNEEERDHVVSIPRMKEVMEQIKTPKEKKKIVAIANGTHCLSSSLWMKDLTEIRKLTFDFAEEMIGLRKTD